MLQNSLDKKPAFQPAKKPLHYRWVSLLLVPAWVLFGFVSAAILTSLIVAGLRAVGVPLGAINESILNVVLSVIIYGVTLALVMFLPLVAKKPPVTLKLLGLERLPDWKDIGLAPAGFVIYFIVSALAMIVVGKLFPVIDLEQVQDVGFDSLSQRYEYVLAFFTLVVLAPIAEEILFRGYLYGKLRRAVPTWAAILVTSLVFGFVHLQWNVGIDVFILSIVLCCLREVTGSISAGILLHMLKNGVAFYFLFINPSLLNTLVR